MPRQKTDAFSWVLGSGQPGWIATCPCQHGQSWGVGGNAKIHGLLGWTHEASHLRAVFTMLQFGVGGGRSFLVTTDHGSWRHLSGWLSLGSLYSLRA